MRNNGVIVTGGAGFVGSHLAYKRAKADFRVTVLDNLSSGKKKNIVSKIKFYKADVKNPQILNIFKKEKPGAVFHYAAQIDARKSTQEPVENARVNILGALNILECCKKTGVQKFIFSSSAGVYGESKHLPVKESHPQNPISPYSATKLAVEKYLNYYESQGVGCVALRYSNIYGPRQTSGGGVIAVLINKILGGKRPVVYGKGDQTRDFLYVNDAVSAAVKSLKAKSGSIYNVGTDSEISVKKLIEKISRELNVKIKPIFAPANPEEILRSRIDFSRIKKELGWRPKYDFQEGLKETISYFRNEN